MKNTVKRKQNGDSVWNINKKVEENGYYWYKKPVVKKRELHDTNAFTVIELFSGCGGTSKGFEMAGFEILLGADIHKPSVDTFYHNHKSASTILGDLKNIGKGFLLDIIGGKKVNVMIAGVPCQGFSLNNRKRHENDERNYLFREYIRFVKEVQPDVVVLENVSGLRSTANGAFVEAIEKAIKEAGYPNVKHKLLNAADYGVPQTRQRIFFVGTKNGINFNFPNPTHLNKHVTVFEAVGDLPQIESGGTADVYTKKAATDYQKLMRNNSTSLTCHTAPNHPQSTIDKIANTAQGKPMYSRFKQRIRLSWNKPSPTQVSGGIRPQFQFGHPSSARGLTIRERCRLQSFPDDFYVHGGIVQARVQTGNAVPPLLAKAIAQELHKSLRSYYANK